MPAQIKNGVVYQGGSPVIPVTKTELEQMIADGTYNKSALYKVTDENYDPDEYQIINDNSTSTHKTWSADKLNTVTTAINSKLDTLFKTKPYTVTTSQAGFVRTDLDGNYYIISAKTSNNNADNAIELSPVYDKANNLWFIKVRDTSGNVKGNANVSIEVCYIKLS